jgi:hypothetical protein
VKKSDVILIISLLLIGIIGVFIYEKIVKTPGDEVVITIDGKEYMRLPLDVDVEIEIPGNHGGSNFLVIKDGYADIKEASCPDLLCVKQRKINANGESLVCLPNKVVIKVEGNEDDGVDAINK